MDGVLQALAAFYGPLAPPPKDLFAFFVWEVISARALPARRDIAWLALKRVPALTPDSLFRAPKDELKAAIEGLGAFDDRLEALRAVSGHVRRHRELPDRVAGPLIGAVRALCDVPHLTASARLRALFFAGGHDLPAADDGVARVLTRLVGSPAGTGAPRRRAARRVLTSVVGGNRETLAQALVLFGHHAQQTCLEHAPHCTVCPLRHGCAWALGSDPIQSPP